MDDHVWQQGISINAKTGQRIFENFYVCANCKQVNYADKIIPCKEAQKVMPNQNENGKTKTFTVKIIPPELHKKFQIAAIYTGKTMEQIMVEALEKEVYRIHEEYEALTLEDKDTENKEVDTEPVNVTATESVE